MVSRLVVGGRVVSGPVAGLVVLVAGLVLIIVGLSLVLDIGNISRVVISNSVANMLDAAIGKGDAVSTVGGISVTGLGGVKVNITVLIVDGIAVLVVSGLIIVGWGSVVSRPGVVGRGRVVAGSGVVSIGSSHGKSKQGDEGL